MTSKKKFYSELCYVSGLIMLAISAAVMVRANLGLSMVIAPAYILHLKISQIFPFFTFGMAGYTLQAFLLILTMIIVRRFRIYYLLSFVTAFLYGLLLDGFSFLAGFIPMDSMTLRIIFFILGMFLCALAIAMLFHSYIPPEVYELLVMEISQKFNLKLSIVKTVYDCISCAAAIIMSFAFFGMWHFEGIKVGTVIFALINGFLIGLFSAFLDKHFYFIDKLKLRKYFM